MHFQCDEGKSDACFRMRGFDFAYAAFAFSDPNRIMRQDNRFYTPRHDGIRIISARKANQREVKRYENRSHED